MLKTDHMTRLGCGIAAAAFYALTIAAPLAVDAQERTAVGLWERVDEAGAPAAWFRIADCNGEYQGKMVKIFPTPGKNPSEWRCTACEGNQRNAPVIGLTFIKGMRRNGLAYEGGSILDPRTGSVYGARMDISPDGNELRVRGFLGIPLFGHTEVWKRLPDDSLPPGRTASCS